MSDPVSVYPIAIEDQRLSGVLRLSWASGEVSELPHGLLRSRCRCAQCLQALRTTGEWPIVDAHIRLTDIQFVADKALNLAFSDGHVQGIYPWSYLREIGTQATTKTE